MFRIARNVLGLAAAVLLMLALGFTAFILGNSNSTIHVGWFFAAAGISYTLIILMVMHKD